MKRRRRRTHFNKNPPVTPTVPREAWVETEPASRLPAALWGARVPVRRQSEGAVSQGAPVSSNETQQYVLVMSVPQKLPQNSVA